MKICIVHDCFSGSTFSGGAEVAIRHQIEAFKRSGYCVYTAGVHQAFCEVDAANQLHIRDKSTSLYYMWNNIFRFDVFFRSLVTPFWDQIDVVVMHGIHNKLSLAIFFAIFLRKKPIIWIIHDLSLISPGKVGLNDILGVTYRSCSSEPIKLSRKALFLKYGRAYNPLYQYLVRACLARALFVVPVGKGTKMMIEGLGIEVSEPLPNLMVKESELKVLDMNSNWDDLSLRIAFAGRLSVDKGSDLLVSLCDVLAKRGILVKVMLAGSGTENVLRKLRQNSDVQIENCGELRPEAVREVFKRSNFVFCGSQTFDTLPNTVLEGMIFGNIPIVGSLTGYSFYEEYRGGFVTTDVSRTIETQADILANQIEVLLASSAARYAMLEIGREFLKNEMHPAILFKRYSEMFSNVKSLL